MPENCVPVRRLFEVRFKVRGGHKTKYVVARDETDAVLGLVLQTKVSYTDPTMRVKEVTMSERFVLKGEKFTKSTPKNRKAKMKKGPKWKSSRPSRKACQTKTK